MQELSSDGWLIAGANESMRDSRGSVAVIYPLLSCLVLAARGDRPGRQETESGRLVRRWEWVGYRLHIMWRKTCLGGRGEIICLDCFGYNKLHVLTSGCLNGGGWRKIPRAGHTDNNDCNTACEEIWRRPRWPKIYSRQSYITHATLWQLAL